MDTDSFYLALAQDNLYDCIRSSKKAEWEAPREHDCDDSFKADAVQKFFPRSCCDKHKKHDKREPGLFKEEFRCTEMICLCSKTYFCYDAKSDKYKFTSKGLDKRTLEETGDGPLEKYLRVMEEIINLISLSRGFRTINHCVATYERTKKALSYFYPKQKVLSDGIHTVPLNL